MSDRTHTLAQILCNASTLEACNEDEIQHLLRRFPYFGPVRFLYVLKLQQEGKDETAARNKAILFHNDPLQFSYFIRPDRFYSDAIEDKLTVEETTESGPHLPQDEVPEENSTFSIATKATDVKDDSEKTGSEVPAIPSGIDVGNAGDAEEKEQKKKSLEPIAFEPYHTVDYFASQGIKITSEDLGKDRLGKQLKSFTEWLKMMKKLPAAEPTSAGNDPAEKNVENMAGNSISESDVVTEAMAEVWAKQGNRQKAMETYNKLSLMDPSKKAYFAAKIESLK